MNSPTKPEVVRHSETLRAPRSLLRARLRSETAPLHHALERELDLLAPDLSLERYRRVLRAFHGFHGPVEEQLARALPATPELDFALPARTALLERDLLALGASSADVAGLRRCADLPPLARVEDIAGCLYVLEGACLGGQVLARALHERLGLGPDSGTAFFVGEGAATGARWSRVLDWLEGVATDGERASAIVASASATFGALSRWCASCGAADA